MKRHLFILFAAVTFGSTFLLAAPAGVPPIGDRSEASPWQPDLGNGRYKNPVIYADYSDPDVIRVGDDYYLTASSFANVPGLPILHSKDLVNWTIRTHAVWTNLDEDIRPQHGNHIWAPSLRYHRGQFYIYWGDPDEGVYMVTAPTIDGPWTPPHLVRKAKGIIDTCPLWDDDGRCYLVHAYAGSRAGIKSVLCVAELNAEGTAFITPSRIVFDGHDGQETSEGPKFYKRGGYYYIFHPAGGVPTGWQTVQRAKSPYGPYETRVVMSQGKSAVNGPHQGGWVTTQTGEDWFMHFQDVGAYGRIVHLQPMTWRDDWPVIGDDRDGDGCGEPVAEWKKPDVGKNWPVQNPQTSDEFNSNVLGKQWQWEGNAQDNWYYANSVKGVLRLYSYPVVEDYKNLWDVPNILGQKTPAPNFTATTKLTFSPDKRYTGERAGLVVLGLDYAGLIIENTAEGLVLSQVVCPKADKGSSEQRNAEVTLSNSTVYLRVKFSTDGSKIKKSEGGHDLVVKCLFSYSTDGKHFRELGNEFQAREGKWIGAKMGLFCTRPHLTTNDGGSADFDWFRVTP